MIRIISILLLATAARSYGPKYSDWGPWSTPDVSCGSEPQTVYRTRTCLNNFCSAKDLKEKKTIILPMCPVDGGWSAWSDWSVPSASCGGFTVQVSQTRECNNPEPQNEGLPCAGSSEKFKDVILPNCATPAPITDGQWSQWSSWSRVSKSCCAGGSTETVFRTRTCDNPAPSNDGSACVGQNRETKTVQIPKCAINGGFGEWTQWTTPSVTCSDQVIIVSRHRDCNHPVPSNGGLPCQGDSDQTKIVNMAPCLTPAPIINGQWSDWSSWSHVSKTCCPSGLTETVFRTRTCDNPEPSVDGTACPGNDSETKIVQIPKCTKYGQQMTSNYISTGVWGTWTDWSDPGVTCANPGEQVMISRTRQCIYSGGLTNIKPCVGSDREDRPAILPQCEVLTPPNIIVASWSAWSAWSSPQVTCSPTGSAQVSRTRTCVSDSSDGSAICAGNAIEYKTVALKSCYLDGVWGSWTSWSSPSETCFSTEPIFVTRTRQCVYNPKKARGNPCQGSSQENKQADLPPCIVTPAPIMTGVWGDWTLWSLSGQSCSPLGFVIVRRTRICHGPSPDASTPFDPCVGEASEDKHLTVPFCAVQGVWDQWSAFSSVASSCDDSRQAISTRSRKCRFSSDGDNLIPCVGLAQEGRLVILPRCAAAIEMPTTYQGYKAPYQAKSTPAAIEVSTTYLSYKAPYQAKSTPAAIEMPTIYQGYKAPYQAKSTPAGIEVPTAGYGYQAKSTPAAIEVSTVYQGYRAPYQAKSTPAPIQIETTAVYEKYQPEGYEEDYYE